MSNTRVTVLIGAGSIGLAIARRISAGKHIVVADLKEENARAAVCILEEAGFSASHTVVDVGSKSSIQALVKNAQNYGGIFYLIHAAGVSPSQAPKELILQVDLYGTAVILEEFGTIIEQGGAGGIISSQSGYRLPALSAEEDRWLATTPADELLMLDLTQPEHIRDTLHAYQITKLTVYVSERNRLHGQNGEHASMR